MLSLRIALCLLLFTFIAQAQTPKATVREYKKIFKTYPYSDPNPIPTMGKIYPYFRYDGYTDKPIDKEWTVVELENEFIKVMILPEIGGKIWTAIEKASGKPFIYYNQVIKFRDIAMRGPWTSGGIEANYGIIGHTPAVSSPVDYLVQTKPDGVSCFIGTLDLLTRTPWRLEIHLPNDKAYFTTTSFWYNATPIEQPYYTWMNAGIKAKGNLQFIYPGTHYLGHDGEYATWPINQDNGKDISFYENNNFGGYKSYHVFGKYADFFGGYWHDEDFGMARYSTHDDKAGKKIWIWGLSPQGMIWEKLLTDNDGQYVEVQSGRLFNQSAERSTFTPFKHRGFAPYQSDTWTEYWFPVKGTKGFVKANPYGALNVKEESGSVKLYFSPLQAINDKLEVFDGETRIYEKQIVLKPLQTFSDVIAGKVNAKNLHVVLGGNKLEYSSQPETDTLARPLEMPKDFDWNSVYGLWLQGKENLRQRFYAEAQTKLEACLQKDPNYAPAFVDLAMLEYRNLNYDKSLSYAKRALSIDTYDPAANYYYGLANVQLGKITDAKDGFDLAAQSAEFRSAAYTEIARIYFREKDFDKAIVAANRSIENNAPNLDSLQLLAVAHRYRNDWKSAESVLLKLASIDPLSLFTRLENFIWLSGKSGGTSTLKSNFDELTRSELPHETYQELVIWYHKIGCREESFNLALAELSIGTVTDETLYWLAYLSHPKKEDLPSVYDPIYPPATTLPFFPFRAETAEALKWATTIYDNWQPKYYLALFYWSRNNLAKAAELFEACGDEPKFAPFYAARAELRKKTARDKSFADLQRAAQLDPQQWRYGKLLVERYIEDKQYSQALQTAKQYAQQSPDNYQIGMLHAKTLLLNQQYQACSDLLAKINILPYEGATDGRRLYRETQLMLALEKMKAKDYEAAQRFISAARLWPENLGAGKPYPEDTDERLEDWLMAICAEKLGKSQEVTAALNRIIAFKARRNMVGNIVTSLAYQKLNRAPEADQMLRMGVSDSPDLAFPSWAQDLLLGLHPVKPVEPSDEQIRVLSEWSKIK